MATQNSTTNKLLSIHDDVSLLVTTIYLLRFAVNNEDKITINSMSAHLYSLEKVAGRIMEELDDVYLKELEVTQ